MLGTSEVDPDEPVSAYVFVLSSRVDAQQQSGNRHQFQKMNLSSYLLMKPSLITLLLDHSLKQHFSGPSGSGALSL